jgi:hypothetical protein
VTEVPPTNTSTLTVTPSNTPTSTKQPASPIATETQGVPLPENGNGEPQEYKLLSTLLVIGLILIAAGVGFFIYSYINRK